MRKFVLAVYLWIISIIYVLAQPFSATEIARFSNIEDINLRWVDLNEDGKLDLVGFKLENEVISSFALIQVDPLNFQLVALPFDDVGALTFQLHDIDHNGWIDVIYTKKGIQPTLIMAMNKGNMDFEFQEIEIAVNEFLVVDIDADGDEDLLVSGISEDTHFIRWIEQNTSFIIRDEIKNVSLVSGNYFIENQHVKTLITYHSEESMTALATFGAKDGQLQMTEGKEFPLMDHWAPGDLNKDGKVDLVIKLTNEQEGASTIIYYRGEKDAEIDNDTIGQFDEVHFAIGDIDLDGLADILAAGRRNSDSLTIFYKSVEEGGFIADSSFLAMNSGFSNQVADIDDDGDLDIVSVLIENDELIILAQFNQTSLDNSGPDHVWLDPPMTIYNKTFFSWHMTGDDHTDSLSISYELYIQSEGAAKPHTMPGYDLKDAQRQGFRKVVGQGFQWFDRTYTADKLENGRYYWGVSGVDNAFYSSVDIRQCPCVGNFEQINCLDLLVEDTTVCFNSEITLSLENGIDSISWFSVKKGFLAKAPQLSYRAMEPDTIYAYYYPKIPCGDLNDQCALNYSIAIHVERRQHDMFDKIPICEDSSNLISVEGEWEKVLWWYDEEIVADEPIIFIDSIPEMPLVVELFDEQSCSIYDTLKLTKLERQYDPSLLPDLIAVCANQPTTIDIFVSAEEYDLKFLWDPAEIFTNPDIANPEIITTSQEDIGVTITEAKCYVDHIQFKLDIHEPPEVTTNGDQEIYQGEEVILIADGAVSYVWKPEDDLQSPNTKSTIAKPAATTTYIVQGTDENNCTGEASLTVRVKKSVFVPDLFSPNGDGNNDYLQVYGEDIREISFRIFDERGSLLFESDILTDPGWDGTYAGKELPTGTYFWTVKGSFSDGQPLSYQHKNKGTVRLVR